jgi:hypothetical protein
MHRTLIVRTYSQHAMSRYTFHCMFLQESFDSDTTLTLVHEPCLPGYFQMNKKCICEEDDVIVLCEPESKGLLLAVSGCYM